MGKKFFKNKFQSLFFQNILVSQSQNFTRESHPSWTVGIKNYSDKNWMLDWILMPQEGATFKFIVSQVPNLLLIYMKSNFMLLFILNRMSICYV